MTITDMRGNNLIYEFAAGSSPDIFVETAYTKNGQTITSTRTTWENRPGQSGGIDFVQMTDSSWWLNCNLGAATLLHDGNVVGHGYCSFSSATFTGNPALTRPAAQPAALAPYDADCLVQVQGFTHLNGHCMFQPFAGIRNFTVTDDDGRIVSVFADETSGYVTASGELMGLVDEEVFWTATARSVLGKRREHSRLRLESRSAAHFRFALSNAALEKSLAVAGLCFLSEALEMRSP